MKTEEAYRIASAMEELSSNLESSHGLVGVDSYTSYFYDQTVSLFDYFNNDDSIIFVDEPSRVLQKTEVVETEFRESMINRLENGYVLPGQMDSIYNHKDLIAILNKSNLLLTSTLDYNPQPFKVKSKHNFTVRSVNPYNNNVELLVKDLKSWKDKGYRVLLLSSSKTRAIRLSDSLREDGLNTFYTDDLDRVIQEGEIMVSNGSIHEGFDYTLIKFVVISESDIFGRQKKKKRRKRKEHQGTKIRSFAELEIGDYAIH